MAKKKGRPRKDEKIEESSKVGIDNQSAGDGAPSAPHVTGLLSQPSRGRSDCQNVELMMGTTPPGDIEAIVNSGKDVQGKRVSWAESAEMEAPIFVVTTLIATSKMRKDKSMRASGVEKEIVPNPKATTPEILAAPARICSYSEALNGNRDSSNG